ncbi:MAG: radical SAM protein [SAR324 cluster bacterium]|nr:radical SAM protein [SAR324 cluster bacterium]
MSKFVFGPVHSRRLGRSLGIDIVPRKCCNLNCIYCEVGPTTTKGLQRDYYVSWRELEEQFLEALHQRNPDVITITGMGEPTLNKHLKEIVIQIKLHTNKPLVLLSNSLLFTIPEVRNDVLGFSIISPSLDAVLEEDFQKIDRPLIAITPEQIVEGLISLRQEFKGKLWLEVLLCEGYNDSPPALEALQKAVGRINPDKIHLNTIGRPPLTAMKEKFADRVRPLTIEKLESIRRLLGPKAEIIASQPKRETAEQMIPHLQEQILEYLKRRPADQAEVACGLNVSADAVGIALEQLFQADKLQKKVHDHKEVYFCSTSVSTTKINPA